MKKSYLVCFCMLLGTLALAQSKSLLDGQALDVKMAEINARDSRDDYGAFAEAAKLPPSTAVPFLYILYNRRAKSDPKRDAAVIEALRNVQGYSDYLREDVAKDIARGGVPVDDFEILGIIGSTDAVAIVAPYLFDGKLINVGNDMGPYAVCGFAKTALENMKLVDAPEHTFRTPESVALTAWQKWAVVKGFVPGDWISRIGAPSWLLEMERMEKVPIQASASGQGRSALLATPEPIASQLTSNRINEPSAMHIEPRIHLSFALVMTLVAALILGGILVFKGRNRKS